MKKSGLLNSKIAAVVDELRHTDQLIIGDAGLPVPNGVKEIDISLKLGTPSFLEVVQLLQAEMAIEKVIIASEMKSKNASTYQTITSWFPTIEEIPHEQFKEKSGQVKAIIRTGEATPYANIILQSACLF